ncbi:DUF982 domain-containing protein [Mesorhizobium amorphae]|uniref:DUF982 domain-containing protein n=1 Tax=Mesorhizobium amorphae CCNWGS0123 TaxID=1082933 RepID=G6YDH7_9HYPH|nr:DUF982 domain-containing protein [Mesorhizobium amorphae]ANT53282.1 hypothetical protein A6B35_27105 [Mesorhizobium amorphae CCNWGS0123]EHH10277.1 hypothetical protein MEA186_20087 [Mesorhizobium amorphae CCNWGS0123]GLR41189.1 hypothetical protein GCM10007880_17050 [Mesorhizobium amorphae]
MSEFLPLKVKFADGKSMIVGCLTDVELALEGQWRNPEAHAYREALRLVKAAKNGECRPTVAFAAFVTAAGQQRLLQTTSPSAALGIFDIMAASIKQ